MLACTVVMCLAVLPCEDLPLIDPGTVTYLVSSHNKKGLNGDIGFYPYALPTGEKGLAGWAASGKGATASYTEERVHGGSGALRHDIAGQEVKNAGRSLRKRGTAGMNFQDYPSLSLWVWPSYCDGGIDYGVRIECGELSKAYPIKDLKPQQWNHVILDVSGAPRGGVTGFVLDYAMGWGWAPGMHFFVDDIEFVRPDGNTYTLDAFETGPQRTVMFDAVGPGKIANLWGLGRGDIQIEVDGNAIVSAEQSDFYSGTVPGFPEPYVYKGLTAAGPWECVSHWSYVPIGFKESCRITTSQPDPFYDFIAEKYRDPASVTVWREDQDLSRLAAYWAGRGQDPKPWTDLKSKTVTVSQAAKEGTQMLVIDGAGAIASIEMTLPEGAMRPSDDVRLWIYWDGAAIPGVEAPLATFFGAGVEWRTVDSLLVGINGRRGYCYFPMPFWKRADIWIQNTGGEPFGPVDFTITWREEPYPRERAGQFRTAYHEGRTTMGKDWLFLETQGRGQYVGVVQTMIGGHYCEGDIRFYLDGARTPALYGTGSEEYYMSACWPNIDLQMPFHGCVGNVAEQAKQEGGTFYDYRACYVRTHLDAPIRFNSGIRCGIEHGGMSETLSNYTSLAYYYIQDGPGLHETDLLRIGSTQAERAHELRGARKARRFDMSGCFEGDDDDVVWTFAGIAASDPIAATLALDPGNQGVRLRRVLDQSLGRQKVQVFVDGKPAGVWYDAGQNEYKRLAESDFEIRPELTRGKDRIRVRFVPMDREWTVCELRALSYHQP